MIDENENPGAPASATGAQETHSERIAFRLDSNVGRISEALRMAKAGLPVFPVNADKRPLTSHGFKQATTDATQIATWWGAHPDALVGMPTGAASGIWAADADVEKTTGGKTGEETLARLGLADYAHRQQTPSGGAHYLFRSRPDLPASSVKKLPGVDVRGERAYIVVYDVEAILAAHENEALPLPPASLVHALHSPKRNANNGAAARGASNSERLAEDTAWGLKALRGELAKVRRAREGSRRTVLNAAAFAIGQIIGSGNLTCEPAVNALVAAGIATRLPDDEVRRTVAAGINDGAKKPRGPNRPADGLNDSDDSSSNLITEDEVATAFVHRQSGKFLFDRNRGDWLRWTGSYWSVGNTGLVFFRLRELAREMAQSAEAKVRVTAGKASFARGAEALARVDPAVARDAGDFDLDPWVLATPGGVVDLKTGAIRPAQPNDLVTKNTLIAPSKSADAPIWKQFLLEATGGDQKLIRFIQQWFGYCLTGVTREHALLFVCGPGGNGKSVLLNVVNEILGDYAVTASMDTFTSSHNERHPTDLAMLRGARMVTASETERDKAWAESRIKQLTGGDPITARFMRQDFFTYVPQFKLTIAGNHEPALLNVDAAAKRRFNIVPFLHKPVAPDHRLVEKLKPEYGAILRWMIEGCLDWQANGLLRPTVVTDATAEFFNDQDLLGQWLTEQCTIAMGDVAKFEPFNLLYASWQGYAAAACESPGSQKAFSTDLRRRGLKPDKGAGGKRIVRFVRFKTHI